MSSQSKIGKAWIIFAEDPSSGAQELLSLLSARKSHSTVAAFVEQLYVDKFGSLDERVAYKKNWRSWPYPAEKVGLSNAICCGSDTMYWAHFCNDISISDGWLVGKYRYVKSVDNDLRPTAYTEGRIRLDVA